MSASTDPSGRNTQPPAAPQDDGDLFSLDFTQPSRLTTPDPKAAGKPAAADAAQALAPAAPAAGKSKLELSLAPRDDDAPPLPAAASAARPALSVDAAPASVPVAASAPTASPAEPLVLTAAALALPAFPVLELPEPIMQAARAYAAGEAATARQLLEAACADVSLPGELSEALWAMLFDVYRLTQERALFDQLSLDYAQRFEKSPPAWSLLPKAASASAGTQEARASVALSGHLSARNAPQFEQLLKVAATRSQLRLDLGKIQDADEGGCQLLLDTLRALARTSCELVLVQGAHLTALLAAKLVSGEASNRTIWLLQLELLQQQHRMDEFEALALDYAITFEESPPSWVAPALSKGVAQETSVINVDVIDLEAEACLVLTGVLSDCPASRFASLTTMQAEEKVIDVSGVVRIDQASAQRLVLQLAVCGNAGERLRLRGAGPLVAAMLEMAGCTRHATLERARY